MSPPPLARSPALAIAGIAASLLATGCAELRWHQAGADPLALEKDLADCQQLARQRAYHEAWPFGLAMAPPAISLDARGRPVTPFPNRFETDRFLLEHDLTTFCMRERGYELVEKP